MRDKIIEIVEQFLRESSTKEKHTYELADEIMEMIILYNQVNGKN